MKYNFDELNPSNVFFNMSDTEVELSCISLKNLTFIEEEFNGLENIFEVIKEKPETLIKILWRLVVRKEQFDYDYSKFKNKFLSFKIAETSKQAYASWTSLVARSMPLIKNKKRYQEIQKIKKAQQEDANQSTTCYGDIYDSLASRYAYSLEDFYNLTLRQIHILLEKLEDGKYKELEIQASLLGKKLKPRVTYSDFSEEQEVEQQEQANEALAELQRKYKERQKENK